MVQNEPAPIPTTDDLERYARGDAVSAAMRDAIESDATCLEQIAALQANNALLDELFVARSDAGAPAVGISIPGYRILREIHRGGQGIVFRAVQERTNRTVAIKILREGLFATTRQRWRFDREIELVANLHHPHIVVVHESGETEDGRPFLSMEYVDGLPLNEHAEQARLGTRDRLRLLADISRAVHHAHQRGVIHRDLKPANILVTQEGTPKVLDFGVASVSGLNGAATSEFTDVGQLIGTVPYMSPEQVGGVPSELDVRSDVYALGVLLYQVLAGRLPYDLEEKHLPEAVRIIREDDPVPLSSVDRVFRGDVETIVVKALQKERARRYQSADALADDLDRYLTDQPILARPPSAVYQLSRLARRHRIAVAALASVSLTIIIALVAVSVFGLRADAARQDELAARTLAETRLDDVARAHRDAEMVFDVFARTIESVQASEQGRDATVRGMLDRLEAELAAMPYESLSVAKLHEVVGRTSLALGDMESAETHLNETLAMRRLLLPVGHVDIGMSLEHLGDLELARADFESAEQHYREALALLQVNVGDRDARTLGVMNRLSLVLMRREHLDEALVLIDRAIAAWTASFGVAHEGTLEAQQHRAEYHLHRAERKEAGRLLATQLEIARREHGVNNRVTMPIASNYVFVLRTQKRFAEALEILRDLLPAHEALYGTDHPFTLYVQRNLARTLRDAGDPDAALLTYHEMVDRYAGRHEADHPDRLKAEHRLAALELELWRPEAAVRLASVVERSRRSLGEEHLNVARARSDLALAWAQQGRFDDALRELAEAGVIAVRALGDPDHPAAANILLREAEVLRDAGRLTAAQTTGQRALEAFERSRGTGLHDDVVRARLSLITTQIAAKESAAAFQAATELGAELEGGGRDGLAARLEARWLRLLASADAGAAQLAELNTIAREIEENLPRYHWWLGHLNAARAALHNAMQNPTEAASAVAAAIQQLTPRYGRNDRIVQELGEHTPDQLIFRAR